MIFPSNGSHEINGSENRGKFRHLGTFGYNCVTLIIPWEFIHGDVRTIVMEKITFCLLEEVYPFESFSFSIKKEKSIRKTLKRKHSCQVNIKRKTTARLELFPFLVFLFALKFKRCGGLNEKWIRFSEAPFVMLILQRQSRNNKTKTVWGSLSWTKWNIPVLQLF